MFNSKLKKEIAELRERVRRLEKENTILVLREDYQPPLWMDGEPCFIGEGNGKQLSPKKLLLQLISKLGLELKFQPPEPRRPEVKIQTQEKPAENSPNANTW